jgi:hypothetical protein
MDVGGLSFVRKTRRVRLVDDRAFDPEVDLFLKDGVGPNI